LQKIQGYFLHFPIFISLVSVCFHLDKFLKGQTRGPAPTLYFTGLSPLLPTFEEIIEPLLNGRACTAAV
jgi:hypothetical protein